MKIERQVQIMEAQLSCFDTLIDKMNYLVNFFGKDPEFSKEAMDIVRSNICKKC